MAEKTLQEVFGVGATQTLTTITINKGDLTNLVATSNNNADSLSVALLNRFVDIYTSQARETDKSVSLTALPQITQISVDRVVVNNAVVETSYLNKPVLINLYSLFTNSSPNPNDY